MEVTVDNFTEAFQRIKDILSSKQIECISFGANTSKSVVDAGRYEYPFDIYYRSFRFSRLGLTQTCFNIIEKTAEGQFISHPFIFYLFPSDENSQLTLSSEILDQDIDWNKWLSKGLSHRNRDQIEKIKAQLNPQGNIRPGEKKETFDEIISKFDPAQQTTTKQQVKLFEAFIDNPEATEFTFEKATSQIRRAWHVYMENMDLNVLVERNTPGIISVKKVTKEQLLQKKQEEEIERNNKIEESKGASRVVELIISLCQASRVPIVLNSSLTELTQLMQFCAFSLPRSYLEFKKALSSCFPVLVDISLLQFSQNNTVSVKSSDNSQVTCQTAQNLINRTTQISELWITSKDKPESRVAINNISFPNSQWALSLDPNRNDMFTSKGDVSLMGISIEGKSIGERRNVLQKLMQELIKQFKKTGAYFTKCESQFALIIQFNKDKQIDRLKNELKKFKGTGIHEYTVLNDILLASFEESNKSTTTN